MKGLKLPSEDKSIKSLAKKLHDVERQKQRIEKQQEEVLKRRLEYERVEREKVPEEIYVVRRKISKEQEEYMSATQHVGMDIQVYNDIAIRHWREYFRSKGQEDHEPKDPYYRG